MKRRYNDPPLAQRCTATITLRDGSKAQCGRRHVDGKFCRQHKQDWRATAPRIPNCLVCDIDDASDLDGAIWLATIQLDLIAEGQDGTKDYSRRDVQRIKNWIKKAKAKL